MKKIISIMLIGMMTVGCGKTARLERIERERAEIAAEQARIDKLGKQKEPYVFPMDKKELDKEVEEMLVAKEGKQVFDDI
jgi:hypothetical protein